MTAPQAPTEILSPEVAARLAEFAKACKAATRIVSMYPPTHPAIQAALARISEASKQATYHGPFPITVLPDTLVVGGRGMPKPEQSVNELAVLLHQQLIIEMTLLDRLDSDAWHAFLTLLAKSPEDARAMGGIAKAWDQTGNKAIALKEIDYAEVLRERAGGGESAATWDRILTLLQEEKAKDGPEPGGGGAGGEGGAMQDMMAMADSPERLAQFAQKLQEAGKAGGDDSIQQRKSLLELMHGLANYAAERKPEELASVLDKMAGAAAQMSPDMLLTLITDPGPGAGGGARMDLAGELQTRLTDEMISKFLVDNIVKDQGANARLATAFQTLVPDPGKQQEILAAAMQQAAEAFKDDAQQFESVWQKSTEMLMHYSDAKYVSDSYAQELTFAQAQSQALEVEKIGDDPPARIRAWLATLTEPQIRALDQRLILDLLKIEKREDAWSGVLDTAIREIDELVQAGELKLAQEVLDTIDTIAKDAASPFAPAAGAGMKKLVEGPMVRHLASYLNKATDAEFGIAKQMCKTIGQVLVKPMSDAIMGEENPKTVRRLRDILISFGPAAREYANEMRSSRNPAVRRAAVDLLRALGGDAALPDLRTMLDDNDVGVQREALRAILQVGTRDAYQMLEQALRSGADRTKEAILQSLGAFRDEKAAPLFLHILSNTPFNAANEALLTQTMESLGRIASDERSVSTLKDILYRGEWWAPGRTSRFRTTAARALRSMGTSSSDFALQEAATAGPGGVRKVARAALAEPAPVRRPAKPGPHTDAARDAHTDPARDAQAEAPRETPADAPRDVGAE